MKQTVAGEVGIGGAIGVARVSEMKGGGWQENHVASCVEKPDASCVVRASEMKGSGLMEKAAPSGLMEKAAPSGLMEKNAPSGLKPH